MEVAAILVAIGLELLLPVGAVVGAFWFLLGRD